jgi:hypothetical protein
MQKNKYAIMQTCSFTGIHLDDKIQKAKKNEMFFCILSTTDDKTIAKGVLQSCQVGLDDKMQKNKSVAMRRNWRRNETLNLMQLGEIAIQSVLLVMLIMSSLVAQAVTLPTAALAVETGPLGGKSERSEGMPHRE